MDCELLRLAGVPVGLVTSALFYDTDNAGSNQAELEGPSEQAKEIQVAICPTGRLIAFLASFKAQFVARNEALHVGGGVVSSNATYQTSYEGLLKIVRDPNKPRPIATAVVVVPVTLESRKEPSSIILVGFTDGYIRAYSKMGVGLFSQQLHGEPVVTIHCMAPSGDPGGTSKSNMSVLVVFSSVVCVLEGWSLCGVIGHAVVSRDKWGEGEEEEAPEISYQKWRLGDQKSIADAALLAPSVPTLYDYLCEAGNVGGYDTVVKGGPTPQSQLITVGDTPMVALYKISKDSGTVNVTEVVSAVASKMTRSVLGKLSQAGGWLGWGGGGSTPPTRLKPPEKKMVMNLPMSTNIPDERRTVTSILVSPLGDLSVCVDKFGRVLLLDNRAMTIKRMWKGYRDAQTGWLLVHDTSHQTPTDRDGVGHKRRRKTTTKSSSSGGREISSGKRAQCLCVYLPQRGLVELWPVQNGSRIAVFQVGKGCRLLSAPHGVISQEEDQGISDGRGCDKGCGLQHTAVLLCPNGQLLSFLVPFPTLVRSNDSSAHDAHLLQKLSPALQAGDADGLLHVIANLRTAQSLKEAVEKVMYAHPITSLPRQFPYIVLNSALRRTHRSDPSHQTLRNYLTTVRQVLCLHISLNQITTEKPLTSSHPPPSKLVEALTELYGLAETAASEVAGALLSYAACKPAKLHTHVVRTLSLKELMKCFDVVVKMGSAELSCPEEEGVPSDDGADTMATPWRELETVPLVLTRGISESSKFDLGFALFHVLLTHDVAEKRIEAVFNGCGIPSSTLLTLLCRVFLSGRVSVGGDLHQLLLRLYKTVHIITATERGSEALGDIMMQCSRTHNVGHALLLALLCQRLLSTQDKDSEVGEGEGWGEGDWGGGGEGWDTVTEEGEHWVRLQHRLEILTSLCGAVGLSIMSKTPPLPSLRHPRENFTVEIMNKDSPGTSVSMALLEAVGPWLIAQCIACWLVSKTVPPHSIATMSCDPSTHSTGEAVSQLKPLLKQFRHTLSNWSLLVHSAWQAAYLWHREPTKHSELHQYALQCISLIPNPQFLAGMCLFLWHSLLEPSLSDILDNLKRSSPQQKPGVLELISLSRHFFTYLYHLREDTARDEGREEGREGEERHGGEMEQNAVSLPIPSDKKFLMDIVPTLPTPPSSLIQTYLALLLHTELALLLGGTHNVTSFYPNWVRMVVKRGLLQVSRDGQHLHTRIATQLQSKRTKFLCESISRFLDTPAPKLHPLVPSVAIRTLSSSSTNLEVTEVTGGLFLLGELWRVELDTVHQHFTSCLFAAGLGDRGTEAFRSVRDKSRAALDLLSLAGCLTDTLIQQIASKPERLALTAQVPPTQLEWLRKQNSSGVTSSCPQVSPSWSSLSQLLSAIQPHLIPPSSSSSSTQQSSAAATIAHTLAKIISLRTS